MAALDFPNAPTLGQIFPDPPQAGVMTYRWDGEKWMAAVPPASPSLPLTGGTLTGDLVLAADPDVGKEAATKDYVDARDETRLKVAGRQTTTGGFRFTVFNPAPAGMASGTLTPDPYNGNYQAYDNRGPHALATPAVDCAIDIMVVNQAGAGAISFPGYLVKAGGAGDALTTTPGHWFLISIRRMVGASTYSIKALQ